MRLFLLFGFFIGAGTAHGQAAPKKHISPSAVEILTSIAANIPLLQREMGEVHKGNTSTYIMGVTSADLLSGNFRVKLEPVVDQRPRKIKITLHPVATSEGTVLMSANPGGVPWIDFVQAAKDVAALTFPAPADNRTVSDWRTLLDLGGLRSKIDDRTGSTTSIISKCAVKVQSRDRDYWFSVLPVNLECHAYSKDNIYTGIDMLWMPIYDSSPGTITQEITQSVFDNAKRIIGLELITAAITQHAQITIHKEDGSSAATRVWARNKARCFPAKGFQVRSTLASQVVPFKETAPGSDSFEYGEIKHQSMPEPLYALAQHVEYYGATAIGTLGDAAKGNRYLNFNNRVDGTTVTETPSLLLKAQPSNNATGRLPMKFSPTGTMHFQFNIRDISHSAVCSGTSPVGPINVVPFCQAPKVTPEDKKFQFFPQPESLKSHDS